MRHMLMFAVVSALCLAPSRSLADADKPAAPLPEGYKLLYKQDFEDKDVLMGFHMTDPNAWRFMKEGKDGDDGSIELFGKSNYKYVVRSPLNIALIDGKVFGDFVLECDLVQTGREYGHRDMCLFFGVTDRSKFYYVHIATKADPNAHNVFIVNDKPRTNIAEKTTKGVDWGLEKLHHVRLERDTKAGTIKVFYDDMKEPIMLAEDKTFTEGFIGFGSFDDTGKVDNVRIWGPSAKEKKAEIFPPQK